MIFPPPTEIEFFGVYDAGVPNLERLAFQVKSSVNLAQYGIFAGWLNPDGTATPIRDNFFWFGEMQVNPPMWIILMTRSGIFETTQHPNTKEPLQVHFWGRKATIFENPNIVPVLFEIASVKIGPKNPLQTRLLK
jgi:hypothetical protein